jgi:HEPN domain-containing protein
MQHDPELVAETRGWLDRAMEDLAVARHVLFTDPPFIGAALFHAQQAAEKATKAFLTWHARPFRKTHDLAELGERCAAVDPSLEPILRRAAPLTEYAWRFRYPGAPVRPTRREADDAVELAAGVLGAIVARLPAEVRRPGTASG